MVEQPRLTGEGSQSEGGALSNRPMSERGGEECEGAALPASSPQAREAGRRKDSGLSQSERAERGERAGLPPGGGEGAGS